MKIILELDELTLLQSFNRNFLPITNLKEMRQKNPLLVTLQRAGLIEPWTNKIIKALCITKFGREVLKANSPYVDPDNLRGAVIGKYGVLKMGFKKW